MSRVPTRRIVVGVVVGVVIDAMAVALLEGWLEIQMSGIEACKLIRGEMEVGVGHGTKCGVE